MATFTTFKEFIAEAKVPTEDDLMNLNNILDDLEGELGNLDTDDRRAIGTLKSKATRARTKLMKAIDATNNGVKDHDYRLKVLTRLMNNKRNMRK